MSTSFTWTGRQDPEDGDLARRFYHLISDAASRALIGFACDAGVARNKGRIGAKDAPDAVRKAMTSLAVPMDAPSVSDLGTLSVDGDAMEAGHEALGEKVASALTAHERVLVLGGGHETAYGSFLGLHTAFPNKKIGIINLDAHLDLRTIGESGPSSGTPFTQMRTLRPNQFDYLCVGVAAESNTPALFKRAKDWGVGIIYDKALLSDNKAAHESLTQIISRNDVVYLTIDMDVMPHYQVPGVSAPAARGVPFATIEAIVDHILATSTALKTPLVLADIVEINPTFDQDGMSAKTAAYLARQILIS